MLRLILAALVGGFIVQGLGIVSWMVLELHSPTLNNLPDESALVQNLRERGLRSGVYHSPGLPADDTPAAWEAMLNRAKQGPAITMMVYRAEGVDYESSGPYALGLLSNVLVAGLLALILRGTSASFGSRAVIAICFAVAVAIVGYVQPWLWWRWPTDFAIVNIGDVVVSWTIAGLLMALIVSSRQASGSMVVERQ